MGNMTALISDVFVFVFIPWILWRVLRRSIPVAILPILVGIVLAVTHFPVARLGIPSLYGDYIGWLAVLVLAFTAGLEMWQHPENTAGAEPLPLLRSAACWAPLS